MSEKRGAAETGDDAGRRVGRETLMQLHKPLTM